MDEESADMEDEKTTEPKDKEHDSQDKKHAKTYFLTYGVAVWPRCSHFSLERQSP